MLKAMNLFFFATAAFSSITCVQVETKTTEVDKVFADIDREDSPGAAVAIVQGEDVVYLRGYGMANLDHGVPITEDTVFDIASISKQFGAMTAVLLAEESLIELDADAQTYVPELPSFGEKITLRHLIHHTSGLRDWPHAMSLAGVGWGDVISFEHIKKMLFRQRELDFVPGSKYSYSNTGYNLLAESLSRASGKSFRELTRELIFAPLSMEKTFFLDDHTEIVVNRASSYEPDQERRFVNSTDQLTALASSSLHTTIADFAKWMVNYETKAVGGDSGQLQMTQTEPLVDGTPNTYAYGLQHGKYRGLLTVGHGGSWRGFRTNFLRFPNQKFAVAVFCNFSTGNPQERVRKIVDIYLSDWLEEREPEQENTELRSSYEMPVTDLEKFTGTYYSYELDTSYELILEGSHLVAQHWRNEDVILSPVGSDSFQGEKGFLLPKVDFILSKSGIVTGFRVSGTRVQNLLFERRE